MGLSIFQMTETTTRYGLTKSQRLGLWGGVAGGVIGCTAWLLAMAGLAGDWTAVSITLLLDIVVVFLFGRWCLQMPSRRFLLLGAMLVVLAAHCLAIYWWRMELWRGNLNQPVDDLFRQKKTVTIAVSAMVAILLGQMLLMHWLQNRSRPAVRR